MIPEFLELPQMQRAFAIAVIAGPLGGFLGAFITLRRMAFLSDAIAHSAMTGVTLGIVLGITKETSGLAMQGCVVAFCVGVALAMAWILEHADLHADTVIAFSYTGSVALGAVLITKLKGFRALEGVLFGDILAASPRDVWIIALVAIAATAFLVLNLRALALAIVHESLAQVEGIKTRRLTYWFVGVTAFVVAVLLPHLGALLISGMIVVPAAAARVWAPHLRGMLLLSVLFGWAGAMLGVFSSYHLDIPTGPAIVLMDVSVLVVSLALGQCRWTRAPWKAVPLTSGGK